MPNYFNALLLVLLFGFCTNGLPAQITLIPDAVFEQALIDKGLDSGMPDGQVNTINLQGVSQLSVSFIGLITDLTGIEAMKDLTILHCSNNQIEHLDLSGNLKLEILNCANNSLKTLNVTKNFRLKELRCRDNELEQLDLTQNFDLLHLDCQINNLKELEVKNNFFLEKLYVSINDLEGLELFNNPRLRILLCGNNNISELDVSQNKLLESISCGGNLMTAIDVSQNTELERLSVDLNKITSLDLSQNEQLENLFCSNNELTHIHFPMNSKLARVIGRDNQLTRLDLSMLSHLVEFDGANNFLNCLNVKNGNNHEFSGFSTLNNPSLTCIEVDDPAFSTSSWSQVDPDVSFELLCENNCNSVGTKEIPGELKAKLFPNPSTEAIYIELEDRIGEGTWTIFNPIGQKMLIQDFASVDVLNLNPELAPGVYFLQIETNGGLSKSFKIYRH